MSALHARVTVVDDHSLFAESLVIALRAEGVDARCVVPDTSTPTFAQLGRAVLQTHPQIVLLDLDLGAAGDGMALVSALASGGISVVVVTGSSDRVRRGEALVNGARAVISKSAPFGQIVDTVTRIRNGLPVTSRQERDELLDTYRQAASAQRELRRRFDLITRREAEVLGQLMAGKQVSEIARTRFVSESTVRTQVKSILAKLQVNSQLTAVGLAHRIGWRPPQDEKQGDPLRARAGQRPRNGRAAGHNWAATG
jgi:two-component system, NarL family, nitrate/nitrite response regulator NarL